MAVLKIPVLKNAGEIKIARASGEGLVNLTWAINGNSTHSVETIEAVYKAILKAGDDTEAAKEALLEIGKLLSQGRIIF